MKKIVIFVFLAACRHKQQPQIEEHHQKLEQPKPMQVTQLVMERNIEIDAHEVTVMQYDGCVNAGLCPQAVSESCSGNERPDQPKSCINFHEAATYCSAVGKRLPTISEIRTVAGKNHKLSCSGVTPSSGGDDGSCDVRNDLGLSGIVDNVSEWVTDDDTPGVWGGSWKTLSLEELTTFERAEPINRQPTLGFRCAKDR